MTELERYIEANIDSFDVMPVPSGSRERFMSAIASEKKKRRTKVISLAFTGMAAACAVLLTVFAEPDMSRELQRQHRRLAAKENEIMILAERNFPEEVDMIANTIRSITFEAIPLEDQLPEEMPVKERVRILNDYYGHKYEALKSLMTEL